MWWTKPMNWGAIGDGRVGHNHRHTEAGRRTTLSYRNRGL